MRHIYILLLLVITMTSCSSDDSVNPNEDVVMVSLNWSAKSMNIPLEGSVTVQTYSGVEYKEAFYRDNTIVFPAKKGDFITFMIHPKVTDQSQNEAGIDINYTLSTSSGVISHGYTNGFDLLIK